MAQLFPAPAFWFTKFPEQESSPSGDTHAMSITSGTVANVVADVTHNITDKTADTPSIPNG